MDCSRPFCTGLAVAVLLGGSLANGQSAGAPGRSSGKASITLGKETTAITGPLRADGAVDYLAALNERYRSGTTPENNGFVIWLRVMGTDEKAIDPRIKDQLLRMCGGRELPAGAEVWEGYGSYVERTKGAAARQGAEEELRSAGRTRWNARDHADLAAFIASKGRLLALAEEAANRPRWWMPHCSPDQPPTLISARLPRIGVVREVASTLCARAMLRGDGGDVDGFVADIRTVHRLASQVGSGASSIERLLAAAMDGCASDAAGELVATGRLSEGDCRKISLAFDARTELPGIAEAFDIMERWCDLEIVERMAARNDVAADLRILSGGVGSFVKDADLKRIDREAIDWDMVLMAFNAEFDDWAKVMRREGVANFRSGCEALRKRMVDGVLEAGRDLGDFTKRAGESRADYSRRVEKKRVFAVWHGQEHGEELRRQSEMKASMVGVLLTLAESRAKSGRWPAGLEELAPEVRKKLPTDGYSPVAAASYRYVLRAAGPAVYSVGENGRDDGGPADEDRITDPPEKDDIGVGAR